MGLIYDTGCIIRAERLGVSFIPPDAKNGDGNGISAITVSELHVGIHRAQSAARRKQREDFIADVLGGLTVFDFTPQIALIHARIAADLVARGKMIGAHDLIIAATALHLDWPVVTTNEKEFQRIDGLAVRPFP